MRKLRLPCFAQIKSRPEAGAMLQHYRVLNPAHVGYLKLTGLKRMASNAVPARQ